MGMGVGWGEIFYPAVKLLSLGNEELKNLRKSWLSPKQFKVVLEVTGAASVSVGRRCGFEVTLI